MNISFLRGVLAPLAALTLLAMPARAWEGGPELVGSAACADCHAEQAEGWKDSHHAWAWMTPNAESVLADFDGAEFVHDGVTTRFSREGGAYFAETQDGSGAMRRFEVVGVVGVTPLQQYLVATEPGRLQPLDVAWDTVKGAWFHLYPEDTPPPGDGLHWTGPYKNWNGRCAECHATAFEKNYDARSHRYASQMSEIGVGCEACHGPGAAHVEWARDGKKPGEGLTPYGFSIGFTPDDPEVEIQQCAGCHARRGQFGQGNPLPGTPFSDAYRLSTLRAGLYEADGTIHDEVYVYGSFLQSKMHAKGVRCSDCHDVHAAGAPGALKAEGNAVCTQCHLPAGNPRFPSLPLKVFDGPEHHFHKEGSEGARCVSCHMVERTYMQVDPRRDHSFRVPRPDLSVKIGIPNACNDCHADRTPQWAAEELERRFPESTHRGPHFAETFALARDGIDMTDTLSGIAEHDALPGIVRATALEMIAPRANAAVAARLEPLLADPDPLVRAEAIGVQQGAAPMERAQRLVGMLDDPVKLVRIEAARGMLGLPIARLPGKMQADLDKAMGEFQTSLLVNADFPETQLALGGLALTMRNVQAATAAFSEAVRLDPQQVQAWGMLARIREAVGDKAGAEATLREGLAANPGDPLLTDLERGLQR